MVKNSNRVETASIVEYSNIRDRLGGLKMRL